MRAANGKVACAPWRWIRKRCLSATIMIIVLFASLIAGAMLSAVFFQAVEL